MILTNLNGDKIYDNWNIKSFLWRAPNWSSGWYLANCCEHNQIIWPDHRMHYLVTYNNYFYVEILIFVFQGISKWPSWRLPFLDTIWAGWYLTNGSSVAAVWVDLSWVGNSIITRQTRVAMICGRVQSLVRRHWSANGKARLTQPCRKRNWNPWDHKNMRSQRQSMKHCLRGFQYHHESTRVRTQLNSRCRVSIINDLTRFQLAPAATLNGSGHNQIKFYLTMLHKIYGTTCIISTVHGPRKDLGIVIGSDESDAVCCSVTCVTRI